MWSPLRWWTNRTLLMRYGSGSYLLRIWKKKTNKKHLSWGPCKFHKPKALAIGHIGEGRTRADYFLAQWVSVQININLKVYNNFFCVLGLGSTRIKFGHFLYEPVSVSYQQLKKEDMFHNKNHEACSASACLKSLVRLTFWVTGSVDTRPKRSETKVAISILMATFVYWQTNMFLWACVLLRFLFGEVSKVWELFEFGASTFGQMSNVHLSKCRCQECVQMFSYLH